MATNSDWWYTSTAVTDPGTTGNSNWRALTATVTPPHRPIGVLAGGTVKYVPILVWDGTALR